MKSIKLFAFYSFLILTLISKLNKKEKKISLKYLLSDLNFILKNSFKGIYKNKINYSFYIIIALKLLMMSRLKI
jgi:hypothetical protein